MLKIGVFDSGIGGLTVLTELRQQYAGLEYFYLGDTAHLPYGSKSPAQVEKLSVECALKLKAKKIDALVVACNTATSLALEAICKVMAPVPVFGVVEPGVKAALQGVRDIQEAGLNLNPTVVVLATRATVRSHAYAKAIQEKGKAEVIEQACPVLVPMIEEGWIDHPILHQVIAEYVEPYKESLKSGVALLGCTHYPWIHAAIEKALPGWIVVNSAKAVAHSLGQSELFKKHSQPWEGGSAYQQVGKIHWEFTDPLVLPEFAQRFIQQLDNHST